MEAPRGVEPTGTNGRTRHTLSDSLVWGSGLVLWWFLSLDGKEHCFLVVTMTIPVKRFVRVRCPVPGPPRSESWLAGRSVWLAVHSGFAVVMAQVRRPVPFRTRKLRPGRGDGTALERVWESSTPPHSTYGPSGRAPCGIPGRSLFLFAQGVFLRPVGDYGRRQAGLREDSSSGWRFSDCGRPVGVLVIPVSGGIWTVRGLAAGGFLQ